MAKTKTTIVIEADGDKYAMSILESDGSSGDRLDQRVAQNIIKMDENLRRPETMQMLSGLQQNPQGMLRSMMGRMFGGGMMPGMSGMMPNGGGFGMM
jgi:hypothetical protein